MGSCGFSVCDQYVYHAIVLEKPYKKIVHSPHSRTLDNET